MTKRKRSKRKLSPKAEIKRLNAVIKDYERSFKAQEIKLMELRARIQLQPLPFRWHPADGPPLAVTDMDEGHLRNTISYLQRILTSKFGSVRYLSSTEEKVHALWQMLKEARSRGIDV